MATVEEVLLEKGSDVIAAGPTVTVREAASMLVDANVGALVVQDYPSILGIFTERDLLKMVADGKDPDATYLSDVMTSPIKTCGPDDDMDHVADVLASKHFRHLIVIDKDEVVGLISVRDLLAVQLAAR